jgi:hypothetical protein
MGLMAGNAAWRTPAVAGEQRIETSACQNNIEQTGAINENRTQNY